MSEETTIRDDVIEVLRSVGFDVRDNDGIFAVSGTIDSGAQLIEHLLEAKAKAEARGYGKGYAAGQKRKMRDNATERARRAKQAFLDRAFLAALPAVIQSDWHQPKLCDADGKFTVASKVETAASFAREAWARRPAA